METCFVARNVYFKINFVNFFRRTEYLSLTVYCSIGLCTATCKGAGQIPLFWSEDKGHVLYLLSLTIFNYSTYLERMLSIGLAEAVTRVKGQKKEFKPLLACSGLRHMPRSYMPCIPPYARVYHLLAHTLQCRAYGHIITNSC